MNKLLYKYREFLNTGFQDPIYDIYRDPITAVNKKMVEKVSLLGMLLMFGLTIASFFVSTVKRATLLYAITCLLCSVIYWLIKKYPRESKTLVLICNYGLVSLAFSLAFMLDMMAKDTVAVTLCVCMVTLPLVIVDKTWKEVIFFLIFTALFILEVVLFKQNDLMSVDILDAVAFYFIGQFLGYQHNHVILDTIQCRVSLEQQRDKDQLTSLYNKCAMDMQVDEFLKKSNAKAGMFVIDVDDFKNINDSYGHKEGDYVLVEIGKVLKKSFRSTDLISRFGGDEFTVFIPSINDKKVLSPKAERVLKGVSEIRIESNLDYRVRMCIGISTCPECGKCYEELFQLADTALYHVKKNGKNGYQFYSSEDEKVEQK